MNKVVKGSLELMKKLNVEAILKVIKEYGRLSRADIAKLTGLTPASVTNITKILIESDYLIERGIGESSGGRPPILLEINIKARYVIGVSIGVGNIEVALTDLGEIATRELAKEHKPYGLKQNKEIAKIGGNIAKNTRDDLENRLGRTVIEKNNSLNYQYNDEKLINN